MLPSLSVIISTYNQPDWLEKALWGWAAQADRDFELIVADDGSTPETRERLEHVAATCDLGCRHIWQPHKGFRKCSILNQAIVASRGEYLVFSDGDCIPRFDFVAMHRRLLRAGCFLSGGYTKLPVKLSRAITREDIASGRAFDPSWLADRGVASFFWKKHVARGRWASWLNRFARVRPTFNGHNASGWKADLLRVNGFDERMAYGGLDRELGERLVNLGVFPVQIRYCAVTLHLEHDRPYAAKESLAANQQIRTEVRRRRLKWTEAGIQKHQPADRHKSVR